MLPVVLTSHTVLAENALIALLSANNQTLGAAVRPFQSTEKTVTVAYIVHAKIVGWSFGTPRRGVANVEVSVMCRVQGDKLAAGVLDDWENRLHAALFYDVEPLPLRLNRLMTGHVYPIVTGVSVEKKTEENHFERETRFVLMIQQRKPQT